MKFIFSFLLILSLIFVSCKKKDREGSYTGTESLYVTSTSDTLSSLFNQSANVQYLAGSKCKYTSSTINYEFDRQDKVKTGYDHNESGGSFTFTLEFKEDSLIAYYYKDWLGEQTSRTFRGTK